MEHQDNIIKLFEDGVHLANSGRYDEAFVIYSLLARLGHPEATLGLAQLYLDGQGVEQDTQRGLELLEAAAALGESTAAYSLGAHYRTGAHGIQIDSEQSKRYFRLAKQLGCTFPIDQFL